MSLIALALGSRISLSRDFHVEILRGGMNRLLLRSMATKSNPTRVEIYFPYVQHLDIPMRIEALTISCEPGGASPRADIRELMRGFPDNFLFPLESKSINVGYIVAAHCIYGEDVAPAGSASMFPVEP
jgi:hypothetical protein